MATQQAQQTHLHNVHLCRNDLAYIKPVIRKLATDYRVLGDHYHNIPMHLRFSKLANANTRTTGLHSFTESPNRELPHMITLIKTLTTVSAEIETLLAQPTADVDLEQVLDLFSSLGFFLVQAMGEMQKLCGIVWTYEEDVVAHEIRAGRDVRGSADNRVKMAKVKGRWLDELPRLCFGGEMAQDLGQDDEEWDEELVEIRL